MPTKQQIEDLLQIYKDQIETYKHLLEKEREDKEKLHLQIEKLQDALVNVRAPEAYRDWKFEKLGLADEYDPEQIEHAKVHRDVQQQYISGLEKPLFNNAEEMIDALSSIAVQAGPKEYDALHENSES